MSILQPQAAAATVSRQSAAHPQKYLRSDSAFAVIGKAMRIYIRHFGVLLMTVAIPTLPFDILMFFGLREGKGTLVTVAKVGSFLAAIFAISAVCVVGSDICMGNKPSLRRAYRRIFGAPFAYVTINSLIVFFCLSVLLILFIVPGIGTLVGLILIALVAPHLMYVPAISALEMRPGFRRALIRSSLLGRGRRIRSFVVMACIGTLSFGLGFSMTVLAAVIEKVRPHYEFYGAISLHLIYFPLFAIASLLMYYDLRSRKEAFDFPCRDESIHD